MREVPTNRKIHASDRTEAICKACLVQTTHIVLQAVARERISSDGQINWYDDYEIIKCAGCGDISFRHTFVADDDLIQVGEDTFVPNEHVRYYPPRLAGVRRIDGWEYLPHSVRLVFEEAFSALESGLPLMAAIGMRAIIEATCVDKGLSDKSGRVNLETMLNRMLEKGMISRPQYTRLMVLKNQGNDAAHRFPYIQLDDLKTAMTEVMHLLYDQYVGPSSFGLTKPAF